MKLFKEELIAPKVTGFQKCRLYRDIFSAFFQSNGKRADTVTDRQSQFPQLHNEVFKTSSECFIGIVRQKHHQIDVGVGEEFSTAVAAQGKKCQRRGELAKTREFTYGFVSGRCVGSQVRIDTSIGEKGLFQELFLVFEFLRPIGIRVHAYP